MIFFFIFFFPGDKLECYYYFSCLPFASKRVSFLASIGAGKISAGAETILELLVALQLHSEEHTPGFHSLRADCLGKSFR